MEVKNKKVAVTAIAASDNNWLTQAADVDVLDRVFSRTIYLGKNDSADNWREVDDEYKTAVEKQASALRIAEIEAREESEE